MSGLVLESTATEIDKSVGTEVAKADSTTLIRSQDSIVEGFKKEYSIVGDGLYASVSMEEAPQWLVSILDNLVESRLYNSLGELRNANLNILNSLNELEVAKNQYQELINIDATIDGVIASKLNTLNATVNNNSSNVVSLQTTKTSHSEAAAIAANTINASLSDGAIGASIGRIDTAIATLDGSMAANVELLQAQHDELSEATSELTNTVAANADKAMAHFSYNASLKLKHNGTDYYYTSGFGLKTTLTGGYNEANPSGSSEFWINAERFKFTNTNISGTVTPFTIDASGPNPEVTFNGKVRFNNNTASGYLPDALNFELGNNGSTIISGDRISTGVLDANLIRTGSIELSSLSSRTVTNGTVIGKDGISVYENGVLRVRLGKL